MNVVGDWIVPIDFAFPYTLEEDFHLDDDGCKPPQGVENFRYVRYNDSFRYTVRWGQVGKRETELISRYVPLDTKGLSVFVTLRDTLDVARVSKLFWDALQD